MVFTINGLQTKWLRFSKIILGNGCWSTIFEATCISSDRICYRIINNEMLHLALYRGVGCPSCPFLNPCAFLKLFTDLFQLQTSNPTIWWQFHQGLTNPSFSHLPGIPQHLENGSELQYSLYILYICPGKWHKKSLAQPKSELVPGSWAIDLSGPDFIKIRPKLKMLSIFNLYHSLLIQQMTNWYFSYFSQ